MKLTPCTNRRILNPCSLKEIDFQIDPYVGCEHYCFYCYVLQYAETDWRQEVQIHSDVEKRLMTELGGIAPQQIYIGYHVFHLFAEEEVLDLLINAGFSDDTKLISRTRGNLIFHCIVATKRCITTNMKK